MVPEQAPRVEYVNAEYENGAQQYIVPADYTDTPENDASQAENYNYEEYDASQKIVDVMPPVDEVQQANQAVIQEVPPPILTPPHSMTPVPDPPQIATIKQVRTSPLHSYPERRLTWTKKLMSPKLEKKSIQVYQVIDPTSGHSQPNSKSINQVSSQVQSLKWHIT